MQEEGAGDGEPDGDGGVVCEGFFGKGQGAGNGDRRESEDEKSHNFVKKPGDGLLRLESAEIKR